MDSEVLQYAESLKKSIKIRDELIAVLKKRQKVMQDMLALREQQIEKYKTLLDDALKVTDEVLEVAS